MLPAGTVAVDTSTTIEEGTVVVDGDRIVVVRMHANLADRYPNYERRKFDIVAPELVDGHVYSMQSLGRGIADDTELLDWLFDHVFPMEAGLDAEGMRVATKLDYLECIESGTTMVVDHLSVRHAEEAFEATDKMGIRGRIGKMLVDTSTLEGLQEDTDAGLAESEHLIERYHDSFDGHIQYAVAPQSTVACSETCLQGARDPADRYGGVRIHTHASEGRSEIETVEGETGMHNIRWLDEVGPTGDGVVLVHCVHTDDSKRDVLAGAGTHVTCCPSSDMKLASGIVPIPGYLDRGINIALGNDGPPCNNTLDPFTEMRQASLLQKVDALDPASTPVATVSEMVTRNGAKATGFDRVDKLRGGWKTDIVGVDADRTRTALLRDVLSHLVFAAHDDNVMLTMVDGDVLYDEGGHVRANTDDTRRRTRTVADGPNSAPTSG